MELIHKRKTLIIVDYGDLDDFISTQYGQEFEVVADQELGNDSSKSLTVKKESLHDYDKNKLKEFKLTGRVNYMLGTLMTDLANRDLIDEGEYLIEISW